MAHPFRATAGVLWIALAAIPFPAFAQDSTAATLRLAFALGPEFHARYRELPLAPDADIGMKAAAIGEGRSVLRLSSLPFSGAGPAVDLLRVWLAALQARDELWVVQMHELHARASDLDTGSDLAGASSGRGPEPQAASRREVLAASVLRAQFAALPGLEGARGFPRLPFIKPADLLVDTPAMAGAMPQDRSAMQQPVIMGMAAVDAARQHLMQQLGNARSGEAQPEVAAARASLAEAWLDLFSASYELLLALAGRDAPQGPGAAGQLAHWDALFSDTPPSY